jgi:hypothetical protein
MTQPLTKEELVRSAWITELRRQGERKCEGEYAASGGKLCALGLLIEVVGLAGFKGFKGAGTLGQKIGLSSARTAAVVGMNDGTPYIYKGIIYTPRKHTFSEIADVVEGWFR